MTTKTLKDFIAIPTIANDKEANQSGIDFVRNILEPLGFEFKTEGDSPYHQPVIVAKYTNVKSDKKLVLYGHYDVERIKDWEKWVTPPFELVEKDGRYYCRGIADNKGILLTRLLAIKEMFEAGEEIPNILWIIQGEEEVGGQTPFEVIPKYFADFGSKIYLEETGVHKNDRTPVIFHLPKIDTPPDFLASLNKAIYSGKAILENRSLNKFSKCPFLHNIPEDGHYIGFGPNDGLCNIHKENESLDKQNLEQHKDVFKNFIRWVNVTTIN
jgi:acetylornithine deacetylase/succinyl-diaminopimelate desuccinylase-like protein